MSSMISVDTVLHGEQGKKSVWSAKIIIATTIMLVSGSLNTLSFKFQNNYNFKHGVLQTTLMFIGEYLNLLLIGVIMAVPNMSRSHFKDIHQRSIASGSNPQPSKLWCAIPGFMDSFGSGLQVTTLLLVSASVNQMLRGGVILFTCMFSKIFLGRHIHRHHYLGVSICVCGFILVGISSIVGGGGGSANTSTGGTVAGLVMIIISLGIQGGQFVVEEKLISTYQYAPQRMVGLEGVFGLVFIILWMMLFSFVPCPDASMCDVYSYMEDPIAGVSQIFSSGGLMFWCALTCLSIMLFNVNGLILTQNVSSVFRAFWDATRTILVWLFSIICGLEGIEMKSFFIQLLGFICLLSGNFIYNEIIEIPCWGLNKKLKKYDVVIRKKGEKKNVNVDKSRSQSESNPNDVSIRYGQISD